MTNVDRIQRYVMEELARGRAQSGAVIAPNENLLALGLLDSVSTVRLIRFVESTFAIEVRDEDVVPERFESIATIAALVEERLADREVA